MPLLNIDWMQLDGLITECCRVAIAADHRYCPKCGIECRIIERFPQLRSDEFKDIPDPDYGL